MLEHLGAGQQLRDVGGRVVVVGAGPRVHRDRPGPRPRAAPARPRPSRTRAGSVGPHPPPVLAGRRDARRPRRARRRRHRGSGRRRARGSSRRRAPAARARPRRAVLSMATPVTNAAAEAECPLGKDRRDRLSGAAAGALCRLRQVGPHPAEEPLEDDVDQRAGHRTSSRCPRIAPRRSGPFADAEQRGRAPARAGRCWRTWRAGAASGRPASWAAGRCARAARASQRRGEGTPGR